MDKVPAYCRKVSSDKSNPEDRSAANGEERGREGLIWAVAPLPCEVVGVYCRASCDKKHRGS